MRNLIVVAALLVSVSAALAQQGPTSCKTIADDKERLACYDKAASGEQSAGEQNAAPIEKTPQARSAYARQLRNWFLSNGISMTVYILDKPSDLKESPTFLAKYPPPHLVI